MILERVVFVSTLYLGVQQALFSFRAKDYVFHAVVASICLTFAAAIALYS